jgi:hypothetical protein
MRCGEIFTSPPGAEVGWSGVVGNGVGAAGEVSAGGGVDPFFPQAKSRPAISNINKMYRRVFKGISPKQSGFSMAIF